MKPLKAEDIVYVSINYRLNSFGFLNWLGDKETQQWAGYKNFQIVLFRSTQDFLRIWAVFNDDEL